KLLKRDGSTIDIEVDASRIYFEGKPASLAIEKDVTSLKETQEQIKRHTVDLEQQVENRTQELLEAQQFAAAGRMASMVGHDLRSPLQSIKNASYLMRRQPERSDDMLNSIDSSVDRALAMLEELRHQTRETPLKLEATDLPGMITDIIKQTPMDENVAVDMRLEPTLKIVEIDPLKVRRILENLVRNALEAMPNGGRLTVETKDDGNYFTILVTDTGVGIPRERLPNLFRPFYTTKSKGLGLGLAYSQKAAEVHGGTIEVESEVGKGTTFKVRLPHRTSSNTSESMK
ncbi:MAG: ATP-binding protein, partial [Candidatus Bathyarchaeia archaeon]